jgi:hypothetical protein
VVFNIFKFVFPIDALLQDGTTCLKLLMTPAGKQAVLTCSVSHCFSSVSTEITSGRGIVKMEMEYARRQGSWMNHYQVTYVYV